MNSTKINPIELLELQSVDPITEDVIRSAKKRFKAVYGLNPDSYEYEWPDYERIIDSVNVEDIKAYKEELNNPVARFVKTGEFTADLNKPFSISARLKKMIQDDVNKTLSKVLLEEFKSGKETVINSLYYINSVANENEYFKGISSHLSRLADDINKDVSTHFIQKINDLPDWFMEDRVKIADKVRAMSVRVWNDEENISEATRLIKLAATFDVDEVMEEQIEKNRIQIKEIQDRMDEVAREEALRKKCHYCGRKADENKFTRVKMFKWIREKFNSDNVYDILSRSLENFNPRPKRFQHLDIKVPRCYECCSYHRTPGLFRLFKSYETKPVGYVEGYFEVATLKKEGWEIGDPNNESYTLY